MKKIVSWVIMLIGIITCLNGCSYFSDKVVLKDYIDKDEHFDKDGFQDYTDYCKYYYEKSNNLFLENDTYTMVKDKEWSIPDLIDT